MKEVIFEKLPQIPYPPAMFQTPRSDKLNDYVYRFLCKDETEDDLGALQGLITSMS